MSDPPRDATGITNDRATDAAVVMGNGSPSLLLRLRCRLELIVDAGQGDIRRVASALVELTEREHEMSALSSRADDARSGRGGVVLVCGESGAGKTSLVETFVEQLGRSANACCGARATR